MTTTITTPSPQEVAAARAVLEALAGSDLSQRLRSVSALELPESIAQILAQSLTEVANGNGVTLLVHDAELSSNRAAEFLGVSRSFLLKLLESGKIPYRTVGSHRRVRLKDLQRYQSDEAARRATVMAELIAETERLGLYE